MLAIVVFGHELPGFSLLIPIAILGVAFLVFNRNGGLSGPERMGSGRLYQCTKCGFEFQPQMHETLPNGQIQSRYDDRCPRCGWDIDWGNYDDPNNPRR